jgi:DUF4097 and DUF4098 domain-containing protein YvlB
MAQTRRIEMIRSGSVLVICLLLLAAPCLAGSRIEKELQLQPGGSFLLDTDNGSVQVVGSDRSGARVVITSKRDDIESEYKFSFDESSGQVTVKAEKKGSGLFSWFSWGRSAGLRFDIEVPRETNLDIDTAGGAIAVEAISGMTRLDTSGGAITVLDVVGDVSADTSGGSIDIENVEGDVNADTSGGHINVRKVRGEVLADTSGGHIEISEASGDINADTSGGSIRITEAGGFVYADTSGGNVDVAFAAGNGSGGTLSTSGGRVSVVLDPTVSLDIDASTSGGSVKLGLPLTVEGELTKAAVRGKLGSGGALLKLRSSGGGIEIEPK